MKDQPLQTVWKRGHITRVADKVVTRQSYEIHLVVQAT